MLKVKKGDSLVACAPIGCSRNRFQQRANNSVNISGSGVFCAAGNEKKKEKMTVAS